MATIDFKLGAYSAGRAFVEGDLANIQVGSKSLKDLGATLSANGLVATIPGYGQLVLASAAATVVNFVADAAAPAGEYTFSQSTTAAVSYFGEIDASKMTGNFTFSTDKTMNGSAITKILSGAGNDKITVSATHDVLKNINAGAGNDTIVFTGGTTGVSVIGGAGADTFDVSAAGGSVAISDYTYSEGDVIKVAGAFSEVTLDGSGSFNVSGTNAYANGTVLSDTGNIFKMKIDSVASGKSEIWTVAAGARDVKADATGVKDSVILTGNDLGSNLVTGAGKDTIKSGAGNDVIWAGAGDDHISLAGGKDTVFFGMGDGKDSVDGFKSGDTTINLYDSAIGDVKFAYGSATNAVDITVGGAVLTVSSARATSASGTDVIMMQEKGGAVKKVIAALSSATSLVGQADDKVDIYVGFDNGSAPGGGSRPATTVIDYTAYTGANLKVDLYNTDKYRNIATIKGSSISEGAVYVGAQGKETGFDFSDAGAVTGAQIWGGSSKANTIKLTTASGDQTIWFGVGDGKDTVTGFTIGAADASDIVYLYGTDDLSTVTFAADEDASGTDIKVGNGVLNLDGNTGGMIKVKDSTGKINNVAYGTSAASEVIVGNDNGKIADYVFAAAAGSTVQYTASAAEAFGVSLLDDKKYKNIDNIDFASATVNVLAVGTGKGSKITTGLGTNIVWGGGAGSDTFTITANGTNEVWYGGSIDGKDKVVDFQNSKDSLYFWDMDIKDVVKKSTFDKNADGITFNFDEKNQLNVTTTGSTNISVKDKSGNTTKLAYAERGNLEYTFDTKVYVGKAGGDGVGVKVTGGDATFYLDNANVETSVNDIYFKGITILNASEGSGNYTLIGAAATADSLMGGKKTTTMWGGGIASDTMFNGSGVDTVWFGTGDGLDSFQNAQGQDKVLLWNASTIDDVKAVYTGGQDLTISTDKGDTLAISAEDTDALGQLTFQVGMDAATAKQYTFDTTTKSFKAK